MAIVITKYSSLLAQRALAITPERAFLGIAIIFGLIYALLIPPFQATDEPQHFFRAYQLSQGVIFSEPLPHGGVGGFIPRSFKYAANDLLYHPLSGISDERTKKYFNQCAPLLLTLARSQFG